MSFREREREGMMTQAVVGEGEHIIYVDFISNLIRRDKNYCRFRFCQGNCKK